MSWYRWMLLESYQGRQPAPPYAPDIVELYEQWRRGEL
jgi:hypothetical protein